MRVSMERQCNSYLVSPIRHANRKSAKSLCRLKAGTRCRRLFDRPKSTEITHVLLLILLYDKSRHARCTAALYYDKVYVKKDALACVSLKSWY